MFQDNITILYCPLFCVELKNHAMTRSCNGRTCKKKEYSPTQDAKSRVKLPCRMATALGSHDTSIWSYLVPSYSKPTASFPGCVARCVRHLTTSTINPAYMIRRINRNRTMVSIMRLSPIRAWEALLISCESGWKTGGEQEEAQEGRRDQRVHRWAAAARTGAWPKATRQFNGSADCLCGNESITSDT